MAIPLAKQLYRDTQLRRWFESGLSNLGTVTAEILTRMRGLVPRNRTDRIPPWLVGMPFESWLRLGLAIPPEPATTTAFAGWRLLFGENSMEPRVCEPVDDPVTASFQFARERGNDSSSAARKKVELAKISVALGVYESWNRGSPRWITGRDARQEFLSGVGGFDPPSVRRPRHVRDPGNRDRRHEPKRVGTECHMNAWNPASIS